MTIDGTGPVLDLERLDAAADVALEGVRIDLSAVRARAATNHRRSEVVRRVALVAVAAAVVLLLALGSGVAGSLHLMRPQPAAPTAGPGALPAKVYPAPRVLEPVTSAPIGRVAVVLMDELIDAGWGTSIVAPGPVLVSADGGEYRRLPAPLGSAAVSVSADGRVVAWAPPFPVKDSEVVPGVPYPLDGEVRWVDVSTGREGRVRFAGAVGTWPSVEGTTVSPDGRQIVVRLGRLVAPGSRDRTQELWLVDTARRTGQQLCTSCVQTVAWDASGGLRVPAATAAARPSVDGTRLAAMTEAAVGSLLHGISEDVTTEQTFVTADGHRLLVTSTGGTGSGPHAIVEVDGGGRTVTTTPLPGAGDARLLAWSGSTAWVSVQPTGSSTYEVRRVTLGTGRSSAVLTYGGTRPATVDEGSGVPLTRVVAIAADVAAGGRTAQAPPPSGAPWWSPVSLHVFAVQQALLLGLAGVVVVVAVAVRVRRRAAWKARRTPSVAGAR